ncbi:MAG: ubiquitin-like domain-containing protein [Candidatus Tyrphobacter sp.]
MRRTRLRAGLVFAVVALAIGVGAASTADPAAAWAQEPALASVSIQIGGTVQTLQTRATTVADLLRESGIAVHVGDYVSPALDVPLSTGLTVVYRRSRPVTIVAGKQTYRTHSADASVAQLLADEQIALGPDDIVTPSLGAALPKSGIVRVVRVRTWQRMSRTHIAHATLYRLDPHTPFGRSRVASRGSDGIRVTIVSFAQYDGGRIRKSVRSYVARRPRERIVDDGLRSQGAYGVIDRFALTRYGYIAASRVRMVATAYTAHCTGCSGRTAIGLPAGPGIVAVDPHVIPLGSHLYIPGYGFAIAGDTGGDIVGNRVDLGFASYGAALRFGRREVTVYTLK